jgi:transcriptional regulator with XRE-family HTH domain
MNQTVKNVFTRQEIADAIGISKRTLERRIKNADLDLPRHLLTAEHVYLIYANLGIPPPDLSQAFAP